MRFKSLKQTMSSILMVLSLKELPVEEGKTAFSDEQKKTLEQHFGQDLSQKAIKAINKELDNLASQQASQNLVQEMEQELEAVLEENGTSMDEALKLHSNDAKATTEGDKKIVNLVSALIEQNKTLDSTIQKLIKEPDDDTGEVIKENPNEMKIEHNATHLFADGKDYNKLEGRNWNKNAIRATEGKTVRPTNFMATNATEVQKLNGDLELFYRENPTRLNSLHRDNLGLPSFWPVRTDVDDRVADGNIVSAEITQVRKLPWLPKNKQLIQPEERKIYPVSIDIEFLGHDLQKYEQSWLTKIVAGGSSPYKMSFVEYLVDELDKKARNEDRTSSIKGVHVATPDDATIAGQAINRQDGILYQIWKAKQEGKIKTPNIGVATPENIIDHVEATVKANLKEEISDNTNLIYYLEPEHMRWYKTRKRQVHGMETLVQANDFMTVENYENIRMEPLRDLAGTGLHFITFDDNIEIMEKLPQEKSIYRFEQLKRSIFVLGDYKFGVGVKHMGTKVKDTDPDAFKVQSLWTNGVNPLKDSFFIPVYDDTTGEVNVKYSNLHVADGWNTDITLFKNVYPGQVIKIKGNTSNTLKNVKANAAKITLAGAADFPLNNGGTLTLYVNDDLSVTEIKRTSTPEATQESAGEFSTDTIDVTQGLEQTFNGGTVTLASIINGVNGQELTITNGSGALTVSDVAGAINVGSNAVLDQAGDTITLVLVDGVWEEISRSIQV